MENQCRRCISNGIASNMEPVLNLSSGCIPSKSSPDHSNFHPPSTCSRNNSSLQSSIPDHSHICPPTNLMNLPRTAPASPPTPAPSPSLHQRPLDWNAHARNLNFNWNHMTTTFVDMSSLEKENLLLELLTLCDLQQLRFVRDFVSPRLKKDPFTTLPNELCLRIISFIEDPTTLARSSLVSKRWRELLNDDMAWKNLCDKYSFGRLTSGSFLPPLNFPQQLHPLKLPNHQENSHAILSDVYKELPDTRSQSVVRSRNGYSGPFPLCYRSHFKQRYMVETAWRSGGKVDSRRITSEQGVVTSLHLTEKYVIVALDNAKIHVFNTEGNYQHTLIGHAMGVWAMVPWDDVLISGGCDRDVRVWNMATGESVHILHGHTSTVRCLKMSDSSTAISGSRDNNLRIWDIKKGLCKFVLSGHSASVRCLEVHGDTVVSGSYDTTAKIWSVSKGKCLRTLSGHFSQIYAVAIDEKRVVTGSLDTSVRIWDPNDGHCISILQGHTSLVGQLQLRGETLVTGGSDGSIRVWSLKTYQTVHRLAAHDNSVTSLQFNDTRIVSGGSDGRVKVWDLRNGSLIRELGAPAEAVWRVIFEDEKAVVLANRGSKTYMELWSFSPPPDKFNTKSLLDNSLAPHDVDSLRSLPDHSITDCHGTAGDQIDR